jgi:hypothetical protein
LTGKKYADENLALAEKMNAKAGKINALTNLSEYYYRTGNKKGIRIFAKGNKS